jgi:hypothetical protein
MTKFLTSYDYAQGGIWLYIEADSPTQITETYRDRSDGGLIDPSPTIDQAVNGG